MLNVAIIGCGLVGGKRALALDKFPECHLEIVYDIDLERAKALRLDYLSKQDYENLRNQAETIGAKLWRFYERVKGE